MQFDPAQYGKDVAEVLALEGGGCRLMPLVCGLCAPDAARRRLREFRPKDLFAAATSPKAAMAGLWLYFSCLEEAHELAQSDSSVDGSFWHAILHRREPDSGNAAYWFRRTGEHPVFADLAREAAEIVKQHPEAEFRTGPKWDPFGFILLCERARRQPSSPSETVALEIQRAEWQLLFDHCARSR